MRTISVAMASLVGEFTTEWQQVVVAAIGAVLVVIVFLCFQKQL